MKLFLRAYFQTTLGSISTIFILKELLFGVFIVNFLLSILCTFNISTLAFSTSKQKIIFSIGAGLGSVSGVLLFNFLQKQI
jgi:hypothetical protein